MGRFYKTSKPEYLDFVYKQPNNLLLQAVQKAEAGVDKNLASVADLYGRLKAAALTPDTKRRDEIVNSYKRQIDALTQNIFKDPLSYRGFTPDIKALSDDIKDNIERGELAAFESNVKARQTYSDKLDAQVKSSGDDHISRERADELLRIYDADFKKRKGTLYAGPSAYQTFNTGFITGDLDIFEEADKILKGVAADTEAWANSGFEIHNDGARYIVTKKGTNEKVEEEDIRKMLEGWWGSNEKVNQYYNTREREGISGFDREGKRREYDKANVLDFMAEKFGYKKETRDKTIKNDAEDMAQKAYLRNHAAVTTTITEQDGRTNSIFNAKDGTEAANKAAATAAKNGKMVTDFNAAVDKAVSSDVNIAKTHGVAPVKTSTGTGYISLSQAKKDKDGKYIIDADGNFISAVPNPTFLYASAKDGKVDAYLKEVRETKTELKTKYKESFNTGKDWDKLNTYFSDKGYDQLGAYANEGSNLRNTEAVRAEKQWNNLSTYANDILGGRKSNETEAEYNTRVNELAFEMSQYQHDITKTDEIIKIDNDADAAFQSQFDKKKPELETNNDRFISSSELIPREYDEKGKRLVSTADDAMNAEMAALMKAGKILFKQEAYKVKKADDPGKDIELGGKTRNFKILVGDSDETKVKFMVDDKEYVREIGTLKITQDDILPEGMRKAKDFYWVQPVTLYEVSPDGSQGKKVYYDLITRNEDYDVKINGKSVGETIREGGGRDAAVVKKKMDASKQVAKELYEIKIRKGKEAGNANIENVETQAYNVGYNIGGKDINIFSKYNPSTMQVEYYQQGKKGTFKVSEEDVKYLLLNDLKNTY